MQQKKESRRRVLPRISCNIILPLRLRLATDAFLSSLPNKVNTNVESCVRSYGPREVYSHKSYYKSKLHNLLSYKYAVRLQ
jgi:hypothetical protein